MNNNLLLMETQPATNDPSVLYHYTSFETFKAILEAKTIRMTHILYMNDSKEYFHGVDIIKGEIEKLLNSKEIRDFFPGRGDFFFDKLKYSFEEIILSNLDLEEVIPEKRKKEYGNLFRESLPYVFCLSAAEDDLSQWRAYASQGGVAIGFRKDKLHSIERCLYVSSEEEKEKEVNKYDNEEARKRVKEKFQKILEEIKSAIGDRHDDFGDIGGYSRKKGDRYVSVDIKTVPRMIEYDLDYYKMFSQLIPLFKDVAFEGENEWRYTRHTDGENVKFRLKNQLFVPYVEVALEQEFGNICDLIPEIWIFPRDINNALFRRSFNEFVKKNISQNCEIKISQTPFRTS